MDLVIITNTVKGDAPLMHPNVRVPFAPTSVIIGVTILHAIFAQAVAMMAEQRGKAANLAKRKYSGRKRT
jgi:uncharacterized phosphosugar-binding protein